MTNQQPTDAQKIWMNNFIQDHFEIEKDVCRQERILNPNDPNFPDLSDGEEQIKYIEDGSLACMVMDCLHDTDFEDEDDTKNWDKELIVDLMPLLLDFIKDSPYMWLYCQDIMAERDIRENNTNEEDYSSDDSSDEDEDEDEYENVRFDEEEEEVAVRAQ